MKYITPNPADVENQTDGLFAVGSVLEYFEQLEDQRKQRGRRYRLAVVLTLVLLAKLSGETSLRGMAQWLHLRRKPLCRLLGLKRQTMPHQTTLARILGQAVAAEALEKKLSQLLSSELSPGTVINLDGKSLRSTYRMHGVERVHLLAAYIAGQGIVLMQVAVDCKENEIVAAPRLLEMIDIEGCIITGDALHAQYKLARQICQAKGHYLLAVKENQPHTLAALEQLFATPEMRPGFHQPTLDMRRSKSANDGHGRLETRELTASTALNDYLEWPGLAQVFKVERQRTNTVTGEITRETAYGITSLSPEEADAAQLNDYVRQHWRIENELHYSRDVSLGEDACRVRTGHAPQVMAALNNLVLAITKKTGFRYVPDATRHFAADLAGTVALLTQ